MSLCTKWNVTKTIITSVTNTVWASGEWLHEANAAISILAIVEHSISTVLSLTGSNLSNKKASAEQSC